MNVTEKARSTGRRANKDVALSSLVQPESLSSPVDSPSYLVIGQVQSARGIAGELRVTILSSDPERFRLLDKVYLGDDLVAFSVKRARLHLGKALLQLEGIDDRDTAEQWSGAYVYVTAEDAVPLGEDEYYYYQIEGLAVVTEQGENLGHVTQVLPTGANDVYIVVGDGGEVLIPAIKSCILRVDLEARVMTVHLLEGLR
jgi:16S rRNA processing protein RimM